VRPRELVIASVALSLLIFEGCDAAPPAQAPSTTATAAPTPAQAPGPTATATATPSTVKYDTAQEIVDALKASGFKITKLAPSDPEVSGSSHDLRIEGREASIDTFAKPKALAGWVEIVKSLGWVAVVGDGWVVGLSSDSKDRKASTALAGKIAKAIGGTVQT
jgi:hypothetical protein